MSSRAPGCTSIFLPRLYLTDIDDAESITCNFNMLITLERNFQHAQLARKRKQCRATSCPRELKKHAKYTSFSRRKASELPATERTRRPRRNLIFKPQAPAKIPLERARKSKDQKQRSKSNGIRVYATVPSRFVPARSSLEAANK